MNLSPIVAGLWRMADWGLEGPDLARWVGDCLDLGVSTFDLAEVYANHTCQRRFGEALRADPGLRERLQIVTKFGIRVPVPARPNIRRHHYSASAVALERAVERALDELGVDHIEAMLVHRADLLLDADELAECVQGLVQRGMLGALGVSNFSASQVELLTSRLGVPCAHQLEASVLCLDAFEDGRMDQALRLAMPVMGWSPLGGGKLFDPEDERSRRVLAVLQSVAEQHGVSPDTVAYAFLLRHPIGMLPITGSGRIDRIRAAVQALDLRLDRETWYEIWTASTGAALA